MSDIPDFLKDHEGYQEFPGETNTLKLSILSQIYPDALNLHSIYLPEGIKSIPLIEKVECLAINIFTISKDDKVIPFRLTKNPNINNKVINILMTVNSLGERRFIAIKDLARFVFPLYPLLDRKFFCRFCLKSFFSYTARIKHEEDKRGCFCHRKLCTKPHSFYGKWFY